MKEIKRAKMQICYRIIRYQWRRPDGKDIVPEHIDDLVDMAEDDIFKKIGMGCNNGMLHETLCLFDNISEAVVEYEGQWENEMFESGWWEVTTEADA